MQIIKSEVGNPCFQPQKKNILAYLTKIILLKWLLWIVRVNKVLAFKRVSNRKRLSPYALNDLHLKYIKIVFKIHFTIHCLAFTTKLLNVITLNIVIYLVLASILIFIHKNKPLIVLDIERYTLQILSLISAKNQAVPKVCKLFSRWNKIL